MPRRGKTEARKRTKPPGIREIARTLGVSIGTVDRALHDRPGINEATRARVLELAKSVGYRPNLAARFLSSRKQCRVGVNLPREIASFFSLVRDGILDVARSFEANGVRVVYRSYPRLGQGETEALEEALDDDIDGLVIAPGHPDGLAPLLRRATREGIPVVCVNTDAPGIEHLATVSVDSATSGSLVGELMGRFLGGRGRVLVVTGQLSTVDHRQKLDGFRKEITEMWPRLDIAAVVEAHDDEAEAYEKCRSVLASAPDVAGVYVSTANSMPVMRALDDNELDGKVTVVTTDLFPALAPLIQTGRVAATIYQRPWVQGQIAFQAIYRFLVEGVRPPPVNKLAPHVVMRSNLKLFLERMRSDTTRRLAALVLAGLFGSVAAAAPGRTAAPPDAVAAARAFDRGQYPQAIALARQRLATSPRDTAARLVMARAEAALGQFENAYRSFRRVLSVQPRNTDALYYLAILGGVLAEAEYDRLTSQAPDSPRAHQLRGDLHVAQERPADAEAEYKAALEAAPASLDVLIALGDLTRHQSRFEDALAYYGRAAQIAPHRYEVVYGVGVCRSFLREFAPAIASFREAVRLEPSSAAAHFALGHALVQSGQTPAAVPELEAAVRLEPRMLQAHYLLGRAYRTLGRAQEAEAAFARVQQLAQSGIEATPLPPVDKP